MQVENAQYIIKKIALNNEFYKVVDGEFEENKYIDFKNLVVRKDVPIYERIARILYKLTSILNISAVKFNDITHGGFLPIEMLKYNSSIAIYIENVKEPHYETICYNFANFNIIAQEITKKPIFR
jgi:hypothetical protein